MRFRDESEYEAFIARYRGPAVRLANLEPDTKLAATPKDAAKAPHPRYRISIHSKRRRLTDPDGLSCKWAVDGLVLGGLLPDDSAEWIEAVVFSQEKTEVEETVIDVILVEA